MTQQFTSPIAILGMHRSGTSCLAGCLEEAGLYLGEVNTAAPANARGNRENRAIMHLHDDVLASHGFRWDRPPTELLLWTQAQRSQLQALIAEYPTQQTWGFKDPRSLFFLPAWFEELPDLRLVASVRHPASVAASLKRRNNFSWQQGYDLWLAYNSNLLQWIQQVKCQLISFDRTPGQYRAALETIYLELDLKKPAAGIQFFSNTLRNEQPKEYPPLPSDVAKLYEQLLSYTQ